MIPVAVANRFGKWLKAARQSAIDPTTGAPFTQLRIGELLNISGSKVAAWERGDIASISPEDARALGRVLQRDVVDILEAIGYDVGQAVLTEEERALLRAYRRLSPGLRSGAIRVIQALPDPQQYQQSNAG